MKIAVVKDWNHTFNEFVDHWDGIMQALCEIAKEHTVHFYVKLGSNNYSFDHKGLHVISHHDKLPDMNWYDAIVCWGSLDRPWHGYMDEFKGPKVLCHAGGPTEHEFAKFFDVFACESQVYIDRYTKAGHKAVRAFGTNTEIFRMEPRTCKFIEAIYPASFCAHKNIELFARAAGSGGLVVGNWNEQSIVSKVLQIGTPLMRRVSAEALCDLYNASHCTVITGGPDGGAQRVVLESMACGTPVVVPSDNDKCVEFVKESGFGIIVEPVAQDIKDAIEELKNFPPHCKIGLDYIKSKWTERHYAESLLHAISIAKS